MAATGFYSSYIFGWLVGFLPWVRSLENQEKRWTGAGFVGTCLGIALLRLLPSAPLQFALTLIFGILVACWASGIAEQRLGRKDDPRIIIDEVVGYWTAIAFLPRTWFYCLSAFVLFRLFDTIKLRPYRWLERLPGGYGVVMDDVGAGVFVNFILQVLRCRWR